ncbi:MAG: LacI family transcriptional regulator [Elusimicrobiota bacterium]|jgi:LacI family transcriptional regulator|nr:LacI family transcriptional regulator [Elusimicrobiota bacterium]
MIVKNNINAVTIKDVAKKAGVSASTVSRALSNGAKVSEDIKQRVISAAVELNYEPNMAAQMLKGSKQKAIGLIMPNVNNVMFPQTVKGIEDEAFINGYSLMICNTGENNFVEEQYVDSFMRRSIDGIIFMTAQINNTKILDLHKKDFPVIALNRHIPDTTDAVVLDNYWSGYKVTDYLLSKGIKKIAYFDGWHYLDLYQQRVKAARARLQESGLYIDDKMYYKDLDALDDGYMAAKDLFANGHRPEAVIAASDLKAIGIIKALHELKISIPQDVSVISFDNIDIAQWITPSLTTMAQPFYKMGRGACKRLLERIESKIPLKERVYKLRGDLIIRDSVI